MNDEKILDTAMRILVAEDNDVNQKVILLQLKKLGYCADIAENGLVVLDKLAKTKYSLVLMDCQMPEMDGYAATKEIRYKQDANQHIPIIAMTAHAMHGDEEKCIQCGMNDYLSKPIMFSDLKNIISKYL